MKTLIKRLKIAAMFCVPICLIGLLFSGCASVQSGTNEMKALAVTPAPDAGFIENPQQQTKRADLPFQKVWIKSGFDPLDYKELVVAPVNTYYMQQMDWLHSLSTANLIGNVQKDIEELALYFHDQVVKDFNEDPNRRFRIIELPEQHRQPALRLELALIEIDPSQPVLHALSWAGPPGTGTAAGIINQRRVAFEGRLRDLQTGELVATFADRDMADAGPLDLTRLTWYGPAKGIMDQWAKQFVQIANRKAGEMVTDPIPFTLRPF
ncbi:DUF3313 family protein [Methylomicrobium sp. Wu6]|uniref:DUF3313 family protein n=1 Tax=Methylomicrobium sp. Wu6 TaxID=3107928 RepID=UPI002DD662E7|nr:DUF3313 family protein [Methylomicrobium sp. Wu6]MEC4748111.1 DUF3313 family protein [Methylomicrobium sp. Wu6]